MSTFDRMKSIILDSLCCDEEAITPEAKFVEDLGAESIDFLDILFRAEREFQIPLQLEDLVPEDGRTNDKIRTITVQELVNAMDARLAKHKAA